MTIKILVVGRRLLLWQRTTSAQSSCGRIWSDVINRLITPSSTSTGYYYYYIYIDTHTHTHTHTLIGFCFFFIYFFLSRTNFVMYIIVLVILGAVNPVCPCMHVFPEYNTWLCWYSTLDDPLMETGVKKKNVNENGSVFWNGFTSKFPILHQLIKTLWTKSQNYFEQNPNPRFLCSDHLMMEPHTQIVTIFKTDALEGLAGDLKTEETEEWLFIDSMCNW